MPLCYGYLTQLPPKFNREGSVFSIQFKVYFLLPMTKKQHEICYRLSFCEIWWVSVQRTLCLSKKKHIWELTNFFTSNGISQSTSESGESWKISRCTLFLIKPQIFECYSKCEYVHVEINSHNGGAAILAFSGTFLLGPHRIKPKNPCV